MFKTGVLKKPETATAAPLGTPAPGVRLHDVLSVADQVMVETVPGTTEDGVAKKVTVGGGGVTGGGVAGGGGVVVPDVPRSPPPLQAARPMSDNSTTREAPTYRVLVWMAFIFDIALTPPTAFDMWSAYQYPLWRTHRLPTGGQGYRMKRVGG